jgi:DNA polymerase III, delta subunit
MVKGALSKILKEVMPERDSLNCLTLDMNESSLSELASECSFIPLGAEKKCIIADNCSFLLPGQTKGRGRKKAVEPDAGFSEYLHNPDERVLLFLLAYGDDIDQTSPYFQELKTAKATFSPVAVFTPEQWSDYTPRFFEKRGLSIDKNAVAELNRRIGGDYARFLSEAQKLLTYCEGEKEVTIGDVQTLVAEPLEEDSYHLANALTRGDNKKALRIYNDIKLTSVDEVTLLRLIANQFRFLNQVRYLRDKGFRPEEIGQNLFASQGRVNVSLDCLRKMGDETLNRGLESLYRAELSIMTGKMSQELAFTLFLTSFSL